MRNFSTRVLALVAMGVAMGAMGRGAFAQAMSQAGSGVQAYFGSQGAAYIASDPTGAFWVPPPVGPYTPGSPLPGLPAVPTPMVYPTPPAPNAFQPFPWVSNFNDLFGGGNTTATSVVADNYLPSPSVVSDASILIPFWNLTQNPGAPLYAYQQVNFVADYIVTGGVGLGASTPSLPMFINGTVNPGGYAQFDGAVTYTWQDINAAGILGSVTTLGTLNYSFLTGAASFSTVVLSTGSLAATPTTDGVLELTGYMWVAGDPFSLRVSSLPEPASLGILGVGLVAMMRRQRSESRK